MARKLEDLSKLCIHTATTKPWNIEEAVENYAREGVKGITVWRDKLEGRNIAQTGNMIRENGLEVVSLCRGGFFPNKDKAKREEAINENKRAVDEAAELGAPMVVLVCGAEPEQPLEESRQQIQDGIAAVLPHAKKSGVALAIEPLHPMYADTRSAVNTLGQANDMAENLDSPWVGVAVDVYHLWWDPDLQNQIIRCGKGGNLLAFHICDWRVPTEDLLLDRGLMGDGCINVPQIREWVENTGFDGYYEVEIFSSRYWQMDQQEYLRKITHAYLNYS